MKTGIYTIGYGWSTPTGMVDVIKKAADPSHPVMVVDVRLYEGQNEEFKEAALQEAFAKAGIEYVHASVLGNTNPSDRNGNPGGGAWLPPDVSKALAACELLAEEALVGKQLVLMCGEFRPFFEDQTTGRKDVTCHRVFVSQAIQHFCGGGEIKALFPPQTRRPRQ